jgi:hypothetical protein
MLVICVVHSSSIYLQRLADAHVNEMQIPPRNPLRLSAVNFSDAVRSATFERGFYELGACPMQAI